MTRDQSRGERRDRLPNGYVSGPAAATEPTARALARIDGAVAVVLVEGLSDQIAIETLAVRRGRDLAAEGVVVLPMGGAHAAPGFLMQLGPAGANLTLSGLCDAAEERVIRGGLERADLGAPATRRDMEDLNFYVCVEDLEDELIRAVGTKRIERLFAEQGDLGSFRTMQMQPAWRGREVASQMRRFLGSGSRRKLRYARLLVAACDLAAVPRPIDAALGATLA